MMRWIDRQLPDGEEIEALVKALSGKSPFPKPLANILVQRGLDDFEKARYFFRPQKEHLHDPWDLKDMDLAVNRIVEAVEREEKILIYGDYDVDGTTSVALLTLFFAKWGLDTQYYIPDRYKEGYGLSYEGMEFAADNGYGLLIALDCGTKAIDKANVLNERGVDLIVVDHHRPGEVLPACVAMINPLQEGCRYPCQYLSACGLTFKLVECLNELFAQAFPDRNPHINPFEEFCDLVTLSIACDIVPIADENRAIASFGLEKLRSNPLPGLAALMELSEREREWNISDLVFFLGPRINSAGRLRSARASVSLLLGDTEERHAFALALEEYNASRMELDKSITDEALEMIRANPEGVELPATVLYRDGWHKGVIGIVASRLVEHYHRPTVLLTKSQDYWVGSGRSVPGFDLYEALDACRQHIVQFGGHKYAAGLTVSDKSIAHFKQQFEQEVAQRITPEQKLPVLEIAHRLHFRDITAKFIRLLGMLAPFGPENLEPVFLAEGVRVKEVRILKEEHIRFLLFQDGITLEAIGFNLARRWEEVNSLDLHIAFQPDVKRWKGNVYVQLRIKDFKAS